MSNTKNSNLDPVINWIREKNQLGVDQNGRPFLVTESEAKNPETNRIPSINVRKRIHEVTDKMGVHLSRRKTDAIMEQLADFAETSGNKFDVYSRVKQTKDGCIIDVGCEEQLRIIINDGEVTFSHTGCDVLFARSSSMRPFVKTSPFPGDLTLLLKYLNMDLKAAWTLIAWMLYTISTGREGASVYPSLIISAERGTSKSTLCDLIIRNLVDPSALGIQGFPSNRKDLVIAANHAHILIYDNLRYLSRKWSDTLCIAATGGSDPTRRLYTDDELVTHSFKVPLVLNGIHDFVEEPDLAQRCVFIRLNPMDEDKRIDSVTFAENFNKELPSIFKGFLELLAKVLQIVDTVELTHSHRMIRFMKYLAAVEQIEGLDKGFLQGAYVESFNERQHDVMMSDLLGSSIYDLVFNGPAITWSGTPAELLRVISDMVGMYDSRRKELPNNPSALSKSLQALNPVLLNQHIDIKFTRGKERKITITNIDPDHVIPDTDNGDY